MAKYIKVEDAIEAAINGCASWDGGYFPSMDDPIKDEFASIEDKCIDIVRCGECKHSIGVGHYCKKRLVLIIRESDYCSYGERKDGERRTE